MNNDLPLVIRDLRVIARTRTILQIDNLEVAPGQMLAVLGPNGAGKTTLLRVCTGFCRPSVGSVRVLGQAIDSLGAIAWATMRRRIGYVPQLLTAGSELPLTLREVVAIGRTGIRGLFRRLRADDWRVIDAWMERLGLTAASRYLYSEASGGEQRKALIARALVQEPELLLLDEPTAHLDLGAREQLVQTIESLHAEMGLPIILVCHELEVLPPSCAHVVLLNQGCVLAAGPPEEVMTDTHVRFLYGANLTVIHQGGRHGVFPQSGGAA